MPIPFSNPYTQSDLKQLASLLTPLLAEYLPQHRSDGLHSTPRPILHALNIACGRADETGLLLRALTAHADHVHLTGVDIREAELQEASQRWPSSTNATTAFIKHDASRLASIQSLPATVDLILMRHQNFWNGAETWVRIYDSALHKLAPHGRLILTSYFDLEHHQAMMALSTLGATLLHSFKNPHSRLLSKHPPTKSVDRHIAIFSAPRANPDR